MSKITNDGLTLVWHRMYPYGNSGRQFVKGLTMDAFYGDLWHGEKTFSK